jgi:predicted XRE-type DNA-binding protein
MNHRDRLISKLKKDGCLNSIIDEDVKNEVRLKILQCIDKRVFNKIHQKEVAKTLGVSIAKIQRFENLECDDLTLYFNYITLFMELPSRKKRKIPKWVYN